MIFLFEGQLQQEDCSLQFWQREKCQHSSHHQCFNVCHWHFKDWGGRPCVYPQVWIGSRMVNYFPWHALTIFEGTTTVSNTWTWRKPDRRMRCLWKMFTSFGFLFLSSTTLRTTRRQRCQTFSTKSFLFLHLHLMTGKRGHRVDPYQRRQICEEFGWKCWGNQHLWRRVQQDHLWTSLHKDVQMHLSAATLPIWHPGLTIWGQVY